MTYDYPVPRPSPVNQAHLDAWRDEGKLLLQECRTCRRIFYYPRPFCPHCFADAPIWVEAAGTAEIVLATRIHRPNHPSFFEQVPIVLAELKLPEGPTMLARIVGEDRENAMERALVRLVAPPGHKAFPLPTFVLYDGGDD